MLALKSVVSLTLLVVIITAAWGCLVAVLDTPVTNDAEMCVANPKPKPRNLSRSHTQALTLALSLRLSLTPTLTLALALTLANA